MSNTSRAIQYVPLSHEQAYYTGLFTIADVERSGMISGQTAVSFFSLSKLPIPLLKNIWTMSDFTQTNSLNKEEFFTSMRLIQLYQNGVKAKDASLTADDPHKAMRPPFFEGISGTKVPLPSPAPSSAFMAPPPAAQLSQQQPNNLPQMQPPPAAQLSQQQPNYHPQMQPPPAAQLSHQQPNNRPQMQQYQSNALTVQNDPYVMHPNELDRYENMFPQYQKPDGYVYGAEAVSLFSRSGIEKSMLRDIWNMVDDPVDNRLDSLEFAMAMHLIVCVSKKNIPLPQVLPESLVKVKNERRMHSHQSPAIQQQPSSTRENNMQQNRQPPSMYTNKFSSDNMGNPPALEQNVQSAAIHADSVNNYGGSDTVTTNGMGNAHIETTSITDAFSDLAMDAISNNMPSNGIVGDSNTTKNAGFSMTASENGQSNLAVKSAYSSAEMQTNQTMEIQNYATMEQQNSATMGRQNMLEMANNQSPYIPREENITNNDYQTGDVAHSLPESSGVRTPTSVLQTDSSNKVNNSNAESSELEKLRNDMQQLKAENISLKAQLGSFSGDEIEVQSEIAKTVSMISAFSHEVKFMRSNVIKAKISLIESTAELKAQVEKRAFLADLVGDSRTVLDAMMNACEEIADLQETVKAGDKAQNVVPSNDTEVNLFDMGGGEPPLGNEYTKYSEAQNTNFGETQNTNYGETQNVYTPHAGMMMNQETAEANEVGTVDSSVASVSTTENLGIMGGHVVNERMVNNTMQEESAPLAVFGSEFPTSQNHTAASETQKPSTSITPEMQQMQVRALESSQRAQLAEEELGKARNYAENLRLDAEQSELDAVQFKTGLESKKKGFGGGKKKKEKMKLADKALQEAAEKKEKAVEAQNLVTSYQAQAIKAKQEADHFQQISEQAELQMMTQASVDAEQSRQWASAEKVSTEPQGSMPNTNTDTTTVPSQEDKSTSNVIFGNGNDWSNQNSEYSLMGGVMGGSADAMGGDAGRNSIPEPDTLPTYSNPFGAF